MKIDKKKIYLFEITLLAILIACTFFLSSYTKYILAFITFIGAIISSFVLKKGPLTYTNKKKVFRIMLIFALIYLSLFYCLGIYVGFYKSAHTISINTLLKYILPITVIIISTEKIRFKLLSLDKKTSKIIVLIINVLIDVLINLYIFKINDKDGFLTIIGYQLFSALACNLLYNYLSPRYGEKPIIIYRLITTLYLYFIPVIPDVYIFFRIFMRMLFPLLIYIQIDNYYNPDKELERVKDVKKENISLAFTSIVIVLFICLISCRFNYGTLVIGSGSMLDTYKIGDVIIYKNTNEKLKVGDVIVFKKDDLRIVHRIVKISYVKDSYRYYTKGDANPTNDIGYVTKENLMGKVIFKIKKIGKPTLWFREQFE